MSLDHKTVSRRHRDYFLDLTEAAAPDLVWWWSGSRGARDWCSEMDADLDNIRLAIRWSLDEGETAEAIRLATAFSPYLMAKRQFTEARRWIEEALSDEAAASPTIRARAHSALGLLCEWMSDHEVAVREHELAVEHAAASGDDVVLAVCLRDLLTAASWVEARTRVVELGARAVNAARTLDDEVELTRSLLASGNAQSYFGGGLGWQELQEARELMRAIPDSGVFLELAAEWKIGARNLRHIEDAEALVDEALVVARAYGNDNAFRWLAVGRAYSLLRELEMGPLAALLDEIERRDAGHLDVTADVEVIRGQAALVNGDLDAAARAFRAALESLHGADANNILGQWTSCEATVGLAEVHRHRGDTDAAVSQLRETADRQAVWNLDVGAAVTARLSELAELRGAHVEAAQLAEQAAALTRASNPERLAMEAARLVAHARRAAGDTEAARSRLEALLAGAADDDAVSLLSCDLGNLALRLGDGSTATAHFERALELWNPWTVGVSRPALELRLAQSALICGHPGMAQRRLASIHRAGWRSLLLPLPRGARYPDPVIECELLETAATLIAGSGRAEERSVASQALARARRRRRDLQSPRTWGAPLPDGEPSPEVATPDSSIVDRVLDTASSSGEWPSPEE